MTRLSRDLHEIHINVVKMYIRELTSQSCLESCCVCARARARALARARVRRCLDACVKYVRVAVLSLAIDPHATPCPQKSTL